MKSKHILIFHTILFFSFVIGSTTSSVIMILYPALLPGRYVFATLVILAVLIVGSWSLFGGCPLTVWENNGYEREKPGSSYRGSCFVRYAKKWLNINFPEKFNGYVPIAFLVLPAIISLFRW